MGTNYYLRTPGCADACDHCSKGEKVHLGKSSAGWKFGFRAQPGWDRCHAYAEWIRMVHEGVLAGGCIENEYGQQFSIEELLDMIASKQHLRSHLDPYPEERAEWARRGAAVLYDSLMQAHFICQGYDFCEREFS